MAAAGPLRLYLKERVIFMIKKIGILFADSMEYLPFLNIAKEYGGSQIIRRGNRSVGFSLPCKSGRVMLIGVECGIGKVCAASAAAFLIADDRVDYIFNAGLSGAVSGVRRGDIVAGSSFVECDYDLTALGLALGEKTGGAPYIYDADPALLALAETDSVKTGRLGTGDVFLSDPARKELYRKTFGLTAFDMETAAIAGVCSRCGIPFLSLRQISDDADDASGEAYREMNDRAEDHLVRRLLDIAAQI